MLWTHCLKPYLARGIDLPGSKKIKANGGLYWQRPGLNEHELLSPCRGHGRMERLGLSSANICAVSFYCYPFMQVCTGDCVRVRLTGNPNLGLPPRWSYIVKALKLDTKSLDDLLGIFLAILSWKTVVDADLPLWCNDSDMILPGDKAVWVKKVLHNSLTLRGRCPLAILVYEIDESNNRNESKSNSTIPGSVSKCSLRHSRRVQS